ncbi:hypothetical protein OG799_35240 [Micromonospora sp. NBC_00898]|uniref:hypothetical protein n=1 Tax=Micromonospora sp. NBC_00898 TaxID=2975981 RepID=UPI00386712E2|nr:hypothetical protein OG799_35240 [Micromonospora sp. NBC_00898]
MTVATTGAPGGEPDSAWIVDLAVPPDQREALTTRVRSLLEGQGYRPHVFRYEGGQTSWGAAGEEFYNLFLYVSSHATDAALGAAVGQLFVSLKQRWQNGDASDRPLEREEAVMRGRIVLAASLKLSDRRGRPVDMDELNLLSEQHDLETGRWVLLYEDPYKARYEVELGTRENLPYTYRVRRDSPPRSDEPQGE